jgi:hypothetical protein
MGLLSWLFGKNGDSAANTALLPSESTEQANLRRWRASGEPRRWVQSQNGQWNHELWLALLEQLRGSAYWPMEHDAIGALLEELKQEEMKRQAV